MNQIIVDNWFLEDVINDMKRYEQKVIKLKLYPKYYKTYDTLTVDRFSYENRSAFSI